MVLFILIDYSGAYYPNLFDGPVISIRLDHAHSLEDTHAGRDTSKNSVFPVKPWSRCECDEELAAIGIGARISHTEHTGADVLEARINLIIELVTIDAGATTACTCRVACLHHKIRDNSVKNDVAVVAASSQGAEVFAGTGGVKMV